MGPEQSFHSPTSRREVSRSHTLTLALSSGVRALRPPVPPPGPLAVILGDAAQTAERRKVPLALAAALALTLAGLPRPRAAHPPPPPQRALSCCGSSSSLIGNVKLSSAANTFYWEEGEKKRVNSTLGHLFIRSINFHWQIQTQCDRSMSAW